MRPIKFRAWDKTENKMFRVQTIEGLTNNLIVELRDGIKYHDRYEDELVLMQYTGLKDKNGKDIYEGDVVKYPDIMDRDGIDEVVWAYSGFDLRCYDHGESYDYGDTPWHDVEVIGNIYENPELLGKGKENGNHGQEAV